MASTARTRERVLDTVAEAEEHRIIIRNPGTCTVQPPPLYTDITRSDVVVTAKSEEYIADVVVDNFEALSARGHIFNNPLDKLDTSFVWPLIEIVGNAKGEKYTCTPLRWITQITHDVSGPMRTDRLTWSKGFWCEMPPLDDDIADATSLAVNEAWANISSDQILALVSLLESEKTMKGILDSGKRVIRFLKNVKRLQLKQLFKQFGHLNLHMRQKAWRQVREEFSLDALADRYMEARYGWRPLYYDMVGAMNALKAEFKSVRQTFRGYEAFSRSGSDTSVGSYALQPWATGQCFLSQNWRTEVVVKAGVLCDVDFTKLDPWGFTKIPETIWDLTPYSFVVDWFFNVSDTLSAWTPDVGLSPMASWVKVVRLDTQISELAGANLLLSSAPANYRYTGSLTASMPTASYTTRSVMRAPNPRRDLLPTFKMRLNTAKLIDLAIIGKNLVYGGNFPLKSRNLRT